MAAGRTGLLIVCLQNFFQSISVFEV